MMHAKLFALWNQTKNPLRGYFRILIFSVTAIAPLFAVAAILPPENVLIGTIHVPMMQGITVARLQSITAYTIADIDSWAAIGTRLLQTADTPDDVACPIIIQRNGNIAEFQDIPPYDFLNVNSPGAISALRTVPVSARAKIVGKITYCNSKVYPEGVDGCADVGIIGIGAQILLAGDKPPLPATVLVHEFGHNVGNHDLGCEKCPPGTPSRFMYYKDSGDRKEITPDECRNFQRDTK